MAEGLTPQVVNSLAKQIRALHTAPPEGVKFVPEESTTLTELFADMSGPVGTPYEGGIFRLKLVLGSEYPSAPPKGYFLTKIFHPNVSLGGDICVNTLKRDWTPGTTLSHILAVVRCLLIVPFPESSLNDEAGKLFMEGYDEYARKARLWTDVHARPAGAAAGGSSSSSSSSSSSAAAATSASGTGASAASSCLLASTGSEVEVGGSSSSSSGSGSGAAGGRGPSPTDGLASTAAAGEALGASSKGSSNASAAAAAPAPAGVTKPVAAAAAAAAPKAATAADAAKKKSMKRL